MLTDRRRFLQFLAAAAAVAACPTIALPSGVAVEPVLISHAAPLLLPQTLTLTEWYRLLSRLQEEHWRESREGASPCWTRYTKVVPA